MASFVRALAPLALLLVPAAGLYTQSSRTCADGSICLVSFQWCSGDGECDYPSDVTPLRDTTAEGDGLGGLDAADVYDIDWTGAREGQDVSIEWVLASGNGSGNGRVLWKTTSRTPPYQFRPADIMASSRDMPVTQLVTQASESCIRLTQAAGGGGPSTSDASQPFLLVDRAVLDVYGASRYAAGKQDAANSWRTGVGVAAGLAGPALLALVWWTTRRYYYTYYIGSSRGEYGMVHGGMMRGGAHRGSVGYVKGYGGMVDQYGNPMPLGQVGYTQY